MQPKGLKPILDIVKENKKKFYGNLWRNHHRMELLLENEEDKMARYFWDTLVDKGAARKAKVVYLAIEILLAQVHEHPNFNWWSYCQNRDEILQVCCTLELRYWSRFKKVYKKRADEKHNGAFPIMNKTQALKELLAMGFVHEDDITWEWHKHWRIIGLAFRSFGNMIWPDNFKTREEAEEYNKKFGLPGLTVVNGPIKQI